MRLSCALEPYYLGQAKVRGDYERRLWGVNCLGIVLVRVITDNVGRRLDRIIDYESFLATLKDPLLRSMYKHS